MARWHQNESVAAKRRAELFLYQSDGVTPAPIATAFTGVKSTRALSGTTGVLTSVILQYVSVGLAGNSKTITFVADGAGAGSVGIIGNAITFHFQSGVTTVTNAIAALSTLLTFTGSFVGANTLTTTLDEFGPLTLAGGLDASLFLRAGGTTWAAAAGTFTNTSIAGDWVYEATQAETNFVGNQAALRVTKTADKAFLDLSTKTIRVATIVQEKAAGTGGNATTLAFANTGAGAGTLDESAYPAIVFKYASGVTTVKNFEDAVVASTHLEIKQYGKWTNVITAAGDTFGATNLAGGLSYLQSILPIDMISGDMDSLGEGSHTYGDMQRLASSVLGGPVTDFRTGTLVFKSIDGTKTRLTVTTDASGRTSIVVGDLT